jgi:hypothetical protein
MQSAVTVTIFSGIFPVLYENLTFGDNIYLLLSICKNTEILTGTHQLKFVNGFICIKLIGTPLIFSKFLQRRLRAGLSLSRSEITWLKNLFVFG